MSFRIRHQTLDPSPPDDFLVSSGPFVPSGPSGPSGPTGPTLFEPRPDGMRDVHQFDGKLVPLVLPPLSADEKAKRFTLLREKINACSPVAKKNADLIIRDAGTAHNYSSADRLYADDLLAHLVPLLNDPSVVSTLQAMLEDMETGLCPQGRVNRLHQVLCGLL